VKAIETRYAGCRFRSRLEARWAVFLDHLGLPWKYEPEGFETPAGWYLPDFWLPSVDRWLEIKGGSVTKRDLAKAAHVARAGWKPNGWTFRIQQGDIPRPGQPLMGMSWGMILLPVGASNPLPIEESMTYPPEWFGWIERSAWVPKFDGEWSRVDAALTAARSARFEHGEAPGAHP
jgi:hypothetical protein